MLVELLADSRRAVVGAGGGERGPVVRVDRRPVVRAERDVDRGRLASSGEPEVEVAYEEQLWRFLWNRKIRYAPLLVGALDLERVPRPLDGVLAHV